MPRLICNDVDCECYGIEELIPHIKFIWNPETRRLEADEAICNGCRNQRDAVKEEGPIVIPWFKAENARNYQNKRIEKKANKYNY